MTVWPSPFDEEKDVEQGWSSQYRNSQRTSTFDAEAAASRMSFYVGDGLLPQTPRMPDQWTGQQSAYAEGRRPRQGKRTTWMQSVLMDTEEDAEPIWEGNFDVEKRQSFATRASGGSEKSWYRDSIGTEKFGLPKPRDPLTQEQLSQADPVGGLVSATVLAYDFPGEGTADEPYMISWMEGDPANPLNFTKGKKWMNAMILAIAVWTVSIASSGFSQGQYTISTPSLSGSSC